MSKFLAVHTLPKPITVEEAVSIGRRVKAAVTGEARWLRSWAQLDDEGRVAKIYCQWDAPDAESVSRVISCSGLPLDGVYPMLAVDVEEL